MIFRIEILDRKWLYPDSHHLRQLQWEEIEAAYGCNDSEPGTPPSADDISAFLVAYLHSESTVGPIPIACGGLRIIQQENDSSPGDVELKRMYVHHAYRGKPWFAAKLVLDALEHKARERGWMRIVLEMGTLQAAAIKFYQREGYVEIAKFGAYAESELSLCYGKNLGGLEEIEVCQHNTQSSGNSVIRIERLIRPKFLFIENK